MRSTPLSGYPDYNASNRNSQEGWLESVRTVRNDQKQEEEFGRLLPLASENGSDAYSERFQEILVEMKVLKDKRGQLEEMLGGNAEDKTLQNTANHGILGGKIIRLEYFSFATAYDAFTRTGQDKLNY